MSSLRDALARLDTPDLHQGYLEFRRLEELYATRTASDDGAATLTAASRAVDLHAQGEAAGRAGDHDAARALLAEAHRVGLPGAEPRPDVEVWAEADLDAVADAAATGDRAAAATLLARLRPLLTRYCGARLGRSPGGVDLDHADVVQETLMAVLVGLSERAGRPVTAFALGVARRTLHGHVTASRHAPDLDLLHGLPRRSRDILIARVVLGLSAERTAEVLRTTPGAVRVAQHRALRQLRERLAE